jgi:hypothetical protein
MTSTSTNKKHVLEVFELNDETADKALDPDARHAPKMTKKKAVQEPVRALIETGKVEVPQGGAKG